MPAAARPETDAAPPARSGPGVAPAARPAWHLLLDDDGAPLSAGAPPARPGARNMALDELMLRRVAEGAPPLLRFYRWAPPCLSLGRNQVAAGLVDLDAARRHGVDVVRRPTGGLAVLHHLELTYAVAVPVGVLGSPRETYRALCRGLAAGLRRLGVPAVVVGEEPPPTAEGAPRPPPLPSGYLATPALHARCFAAAAPGEIAAHGRKLVGSAQRREGRALLQHGSILLDGGQALVAELFGGGEPGPPAAGTLPTSLREVLGAAPAPAPLAAALRAGLEDVLGIALAPAPLDAEGRDALAALETRYRSARWTWRR